MVFMGKHVRNPCVIPRNQRVDLNQDAAEQGSADDAVLAFVDDGVVGIARKDRDGDVVIVVIRKNGNHPSQFASQRVDIQPFQLVALLFQRVHIADGLRLSVAQIEGELRTSLQVGIT